MMDEQIICDTCGTKYEPEEKNCPLCGRTNQ